MIIKTLADAKKFCAKAKDGDQWIFDGWPDPPISEKDTENHEKKFADAKKLEQDIFSSFQADLVTDEKQDRIKENRRIEFLKEKEPKYSVMSAEMMEAAFSLPQNREMALALLIKLLPTDDTNKKICRKISDDFDKRIPGRKINYTDVYAQEVNKSTPRGIPDPLPGLDKIRGSKADVRRLNVGYLLQEAMHMTVEEMARKYTKAQNKDMVLALGLSATSDRGDGRQRADTEVMLSAKTYNYFRGK